MVRPLLRSLGLLFVYRKRLLSQEYEVLNLVHKLAYLNKWILKYCKAVKQVHKGGKHACGNYQRTF